MIVSHVNNWWRTCSRCTENPAKQDGTPKNQLSLFAILRGAARPNRTAPRCLLTHQMKAISRRAAPLQALRKCPPFARRSEFRAYYPPGGLVAAAKANLGSFSHRRRGQLYARLSPEHFPHFRHYCGAQTPAPARATRSPTIG